MAIIDTVERIVDATWRFLKLPTIIGDEFVPGDTTPNVSNRLAFTCSTTPITITNFINGAAYQTIMILGTGQATIQHGTNIFTNTGANKLLEDKKIYHFSQFNNKWYEDA